MEGYFQEGKRLGYRDAKAGLTWEKNPYRKSIPTPANTQREKGWEAGFEAYLDEVEGKK